MMCRLIFKRENEDLECCFEEGETYADILLAIDVVPDTVILSKNGKFIPEDEPAKEGEIIVYTTSSRG
ncbi:MoaD/ThiS family protein [Methanoplanus sp. FWC-SCC4]|uniref:MoaD/ThiS family protein n=1 Tax=Methanochimaera problematica TaxID=2609417 RepID=A0AA97FCP1_9EURY|nr:thiamine S protein [Methanoplanus sp. FWC-SCC4]WOF16985.1 MoaD/ThiS family protein [Methanoplanus sp. FWC-SCC4]